ncbi:DNA-binding FadR family transcriptional regulator [Erwinia toletana]|uniref:DNA-binding FadR family transcriptional regulator n=1 Tax=Winslowiella toletana TaxID=92490 RepID=A0ABS4PCW1_9GAMM|nr:FCD domain-containing protein [Winslowiella toletana]MBP2170017.1 DNA-binding FadR family transcriptional regulator [Winslowiella toletana]
MTTIKSAATRSPVKEKQQEKLEHLVSEIKKLTQTKGMLPAERVLAGKLNIKRHLLRSALQLMRDRGEIPPARPGRRTSEPKAKSRVEKGSNHSNTPQDAVSNFIGSDLVRSTNPLEVMEMRMMLEPALARLAALRASPEEIAAIKAAASTPDDLTPSEADQRFHRAIATGSRNSLVSELFVLLNQVASDSRLRFAQSDEETTHDRIAQRDQEHHLIADAIASRDCDGAERAMWQHLAVVQQKIISRLGFAPSKKDYA